MDLLTEIKSKVTQFPEVDRLGVEAIIRHLEQAERYLERGRVGEEDYFTDVIYRTNHAYEGSLKEAYEKLVGEDASRKTPHEIENHLERNNILRSRVLDLMRNYRQEWRNPSTHEYALFFSEQEAILAITTVSAFVAVLLDQIIDQLAVKAQKPLITALQSSVTSAISGYESLPFPDQVVELIRFFLTKTRFPPSVPKAHIESFFEAAMDNFLRRADPRMSITLEPTISAKSQTLRPDLLLKKADDIVVVEIKRAQRRSLKREAAVLQVLLSAKYVGAKRAIIVFTPDGTGPVVVETKQFTTTGVPTMVTEIYPENQSLPPGESAK